MDRKSRLVAELKLLESGKKFLDESKKSENGKTYREYAIEHLKQGNLCKGYVDYILSKMTKLEQIEQIVASWNNDASHSFSDMCKINGILKE